MTKDNVLVLLKQKKDYVSGEEISRELGVSRAAVNTAVKKLRAEGYEILSATNRGYSLQRSVDSLTAGEIYPYIPKERRETVHCLEQVDSTNTYLKKLAQEGAADGTIVIANEQTAGRGRLGRSFQSKKNTGIYMSMLMRPEQGIENISEITAWVAVAVAKAIEKVAGVKPGIKWVNDLILGKKKICGILTEMAMEGESGHIQYLVTGIGINVHNKIEDFPEELRATASSILEETGKQISRAELAATLIQELDTMYQQWPKEKERYLAYYREVCVTVGKEIRILRRGEEKAGTAVDVTDEFHLQVAYPDGSEEIISSGEVSVRGMYGYV